jgi:ornithine decarboxylase
MKTPYVNFDYEQLKAKYSEFRSLMPRVKIAYAVKANSHPDVIYTLAKAGCWFDVASLAEVTLTNYTGLERFYSNPIRNVDMLLEAYCAGVRYFVIDSFDGIQQLALLSDEVLSEIKVYLRLYIPNDSAVFALNRKFGMTPNHVGPIILACQQAGIRLVGVSFHVGSQCLNPEAFREPMRVALGVLKHIKDAYPGERMLLNLGGGFPATDELALSDFADVINEELMGVEDTDVVAEPGRGMVSACGTLFTRVLAVKKIGQAKPIAYLDAGAYHGLTEIKQGLAFEFTSTNPQSRPLEYCAWTVAGPTCDSYDMLGDFELPVDLKVGDLLTMRNAGAYVTECGTRFNGFPSPELTGCRAL